MSFADLLLFSGTALGGHRLRTSLSLLGVAIGVVSVILLTSLGEGARRYVIEEFASLGTNLVVVLPGKTETTGMLPIMGGTPHDLTLEDAEALRRTVPHVRRVAPLSLGTASARYGERSREITVLGTTAEMLGVRKIAIRTGRYLPEEATEQERRLCVIGAKIQSELFGSANPLGEILRIGNERFRVVGVTTRRGTSIGMNMDDVVHVPVARALKMFNRSGLFRILIEVRSHDEIEPARAAILKLLTERHANEEDVTILTQDSVIATFARILGILTAALAGIAAISLTVAGVGIMNVMLVSVAERTREIGLLKAVGASRGQILRVFLVEAAILSTSGGLVGLAVAFAVTRSLRALFPTFPVDPPGWAVASAIVVSILVGILFGALPARRAARLNPIAALARR